MRIKLISAVLLIGMFCFGCSKSGQPGPKDNGGTTTGNSDLKIEIVSGNNQTDTIGYPLPNFVNVKVTSTSGASLDGYGVQYERSGCNADLTNILGLKDDGTSGINWYLAGDVGQQTLKIIVLDAQNKHVDSVAAVATAVAPAKGGWHYSACTPFGVGAGAFCKLSTGRLFAAFQISKGYLRYSDDNGASWNPVKSLGNTHNFLTVVSTPADEIFAIASDDNYYSKDQGQTWTALGVQGFNSKEISGIAFTPKGKLFITTRFSSQYISSDKGKTWLTIPSSALVYPNEGADNDFRSPSEDKDGNLYLLSSEEGHIFKSTDNGKTWGYLNFPNYRFTDFFIDKNNWFYVSINSLPYGIYISKNQGASFDLLSNSGTGLNKKLSLQSDGNLYYTVDDVGLYRLNGAAPPARLILNSRGPGASPYIVAKNNNVVVSSGGFPLLYNNK